MGQWDTEGADNGTQNRTMGHAAGAMGHNPGHWTLDTVTVRDSTVTSFRTLSNRRNDESCGVCGVLSRRLRCVTLCSAG